MMIPQSLILLKKTEGAMMIQKRDVLTIRVSITSLLCALIICACTAERPARVYPEDSFVWYDKAGEAQYSNVGEDTNFVLMHYHMGYMDGYKDGCAGTEGASYQTITATGGKAYDKDGKLIFETSD
jgi:hypothetical protein